MSYYDFGEPPVRAPRSGRGSAVQTWPRALELTKNQVRWKLECPEDSMSYYDFGEPPVGAPRSGRVTAFESAPPPKAAVILESSPPGPLKGHHPGSRATNEAGISKKRKSLKKCNPINDWIDPEGMPLMGVGGWSDGPRPRFD